MLRHSRLVAAVCMHAHVRMHASACSFPPCAQPTADARWRAAAALAGCSVKQLRETCAALAAAAPRLAALRHVSIGAELDALLSNSKGHVLAPLSALTQLTSLALSDFPHLHPDAPAHEGYSVVPPVLAALPRLARAELRLCTGHAAQLALAAGVPDVSLALTLARHEQVQFNR